MIVGMNESNPKPEVLYKDDKKISIALMATFVTLTAQYFILVFFDLSGLNVSSRIQLLSKGVVAMVFLYALPSVLKRSRIKFFVIYMLTTIVLLFHYLIFEGNRPYITDKMIPIFTMSLPGFIYASCIRDFAVFKSTMKKAANVVFFIGLLLTLLIFTGRASIGSYSMAFSYYMLLPAIMFTDDFLDKFSFKMLAFDILSIIIILSLGSRGAILCIMVFTLLKFFRRNAKLSNVRLIGDLSLIVVALIMLIYLDQILVYLYGFIGKFGINSRTLRIFLSQGLYLSGRDTIYESIVSEILKHPLFGIGIGGDRNVLGGAYAHNILIEIIANYGIPLGIVVILFIFINILKALLRKDPFDYSIAIIWLSLGFVHFMVSGSYIVDIRFWTFLGVILNITRNNSQIKNEAL